MGVHYAVERQLHNSLEIKDQLRVLLLFWCTCFYSKFPKYVAVWIDHNMQSYLRPQRQMFVLYDVHQRLQEVEFTGLGSKTTAVIIVHKLKWDLSKTTTTFYQYALQSLCYWAHYNSGICMFCVRVIFYKRESFKKEFLYTAIIAVVVDELTKQTMMHSQQLINLLPTV